MLRTTLAAAILLVGSFPALSARAAEAVYRLPSETAFILNLDLQAVRNSAVGGRILDAAIDKAVEKIAKKGNVDREKALQQVAEIVGFDPLKEVKSITVSAVDYEHPEKSLVGVVQLGKSTGNLEGLLLGLPNYQVTDYEGQQIHSADREPGEAMYVAFLTGDDGNRRIVFSAQREGVESAIDQAAGKSASADGSTDFNVEQADDRLLSLKVIKFPKDAVKEGPPANVVKLLKDATVHIDEADDRIGIHVALTATDERQAEQLRQMAEGGVAMLQFAKSANPEDQKLQKLTSLVEEAETSLDGATATVSLKIPAGELTAILDEKLKNK
jgi:hypothetical protein